MLLDSLSGTRLRKTLSGIWLVFTILFFMGIYLYRSYYNYILAAYIAIMFGLTWEAIMAHK